MRTFDWIISGGGIKGLFAAYQLSKLGKSVCIIEGSPFLGGVLASKKIESFYLDLGCHLFDNVNDQITKMMIDLNVNNINPVFVNYSSKILGKITQDFAVPCFYTKDKLNEIIKREIISAKLDTRIPKNYKEYLDLRYGDKVSDILRHSVKKILRQDAENLDVESKNILPFNRVVIANNKKSNELKKDTLLSEKIASSKKFHTFPRQAYSYRNFYPCYNGMYGFIENAKNFLIKKGVEIYTSKKITRVEMKKNQLFFKTEDDNSFSSKYCYWSSDLRIIENSINTKYPVSHLIHKVPMVVYYYFLDPKFISNQTYIHNFDQEDFIFRTSCPGVYGNQYNNEKLTYVCFEVPTDEGSELWNNPDKFSNKIWDEAIKMGQVKGSEPSKKYVLKTPVSFKPLKKGFSKTYKKFFNDVNKNFNNLYVSSPALYSKVQIASEIDNMIKEFDC